MAIFLALLFILTARIVLKFIVSKEPVQMPHEVLEQAREQGFFASVFGTKPIRRLIGYAPAIAFGFFIGQWWVGFAAIAAHLGLATMWWLMLIRQA
jgi:hypothetical protein